MVTRVICYKCKRSLKVKKIIEDDDGLIVIVESCNGCMTSKESPHRKEFEKHLCDMLIEEPRNEMLLNIEYEDDNRPS